MKQETPARREDVRAARPYLLSRTSLRGLARRLASILALIAIDVSGLVIGVYAALVLRAIVVDPKPILWGILWDQESSWLAFLILMLVLVFWQKGLYRPRELREGAGRIVPSVLLVAALALAFAIGTNQHITTLGLYVAGVFTVSAAVSLLRVSYELASGSVMRAFGVRRRTVIVGAPDERARLRETLGASRGGIVYAFAGEVGTGQEVEAMLAREQLDELIVADGGLDDERLIEIVEAAHRRSVHVRIAPRTTELLVERGEYVPGHGVPLFELRPPILAGADWATKRTFDIVVSVGILIAGAPVWLLVAIAIKATSRGPVFYADRRVGLGEREFRMLKFRTMVADADRSKPALESSNEAGTLFKIRDDPRVTSVGRTLRRLSIDEVPNLLNVLRGEMSLVGPRPLPIRDFGLLEPWHRRRYNVLPGMTGLWQVAGRSDLAFDDLVRLDLYYIENWSIWLDVTILVKTPVAVLSKRGAY